MATKYQKSCDFSIDSLYTIYLRKPKQDFLFTGEVHNFWEMMYCSCGSAVVCAGERILELKCNQVIFFKPMEFHSFRIEENTESEFFICSFDLSGAFADKLADKVFNTSTEHSRVIGELINHIKMNVDDFEKNIDDNMLKYLSEIPLSVNTVSNLLENFIILLLKQGNTPSALLKTHETKIYSNALKTIDSCIKRKITVSELSRSCNVSPSYLKTIFKKYNGLGIHEYILKIKINYAKRMLTEGKTVTEIAEELGFTTQNYLSTVFKRETGMSASEYKKQ